MMFCRLVPKTNGSHSSSPSPSPSPGGYAPISAEARKERDKKHIDDITAARLPPLHHSPAMLLSLEESADLQCEQTRKHKVSPVETYVRQTHTTT